MKVKQDVEEGHETQQDLLITSGDGRGRRPGGLPDFSFDEISGGKATQCDRDPGEGAAQAELHLRACEWTSK